MNNSPQQTLYVATGNKNKLGEIQRILEEYQVIGKSLSILEVQSEDPEIVLREKAIAAYHLNANQPILVEDGSLSIPSLQNLPGPFADQFTNTLVKREALCRMVPANDRRVIFQVGLAIYDGEQVSTWIASSEGTISLHPRGEREFGFDDIFIPHGQKGEKTKTYAEMTPEEKDSFSPRPKALHMFIRNPMTNSTKSSIL